MGKWTASWTDPRLYRDSRDPLEFALSIVNETTEALGKEGVDVAGNEKRDDEGIPGFGQHIRPALVSHLANIANQRESTIGRVLSESFGHGDIGLQLSGLELIPQGKRWRYRKSSIFRSARDHRLLTLTAILVLLEVKAHAWRKERLRRCSYCGRFFFHSQNRRNEKFWCREKCMTRIGLTEREKADHAAYMRAQRLEKKNQGALGRDRARAARQILEDLGR